ncbi:ribonuclease-III-like-domain-containing protein [Scheffersomyces xylosifermentans]|uniref:ribonuclease-III-like-domain-containing protein n=1 Tax=Scheffersomyces xylosifermentans TaxID=1304137 RepID=UPI00315CA243
MSIRQLGSPGKLINAANSLRCWEGSRYSALRSIYLHKGPRVAGLKRDPEEAFVTHNGHKYGVSEENLKPIKSFLSDKYAITDDLALQVLTHKSFGNGIKPYNEKLGAMGSKMLNLFFAKFVVEQPSTNELAINGKNLDVLGTPVAKELAGRLALGIFARSNNLNSTMFWKSYNHGVGFETSGEMKVSAQMMYALVGAVTFVHGKTVAEEFIREKLLGASPSIEDITSSVVEKAQ